MRYSLLVLCLAVLWLAPPTADAMECPAIINAEFGGW